jgi:signal transduction histidine kinase/CheY-like chemotaxis protein
MTESIASLFQKPLAPALVSKERIWTSVLVFGAFLLTSQLGTFIYRDLGTAPAIVWAAQGVAFAAVILAGYEILPAIFLASLVSGALSGTPPIILLGVALGNIIQPAAGYYFLEKAGFDRALARVKDMFLILVVSLGATMVAPAFDAAAVALHNHFSGDTFIIHWTFWWVGGALSAVILTPFLIRWIRFKMAPRSPGKIAECLLTVFLIALTSYLIYATVHTTFLGFPLSYILIADLVWIAFRVGPRFMTLALFLMTFISLAGALFGTHPPSATALPLSQRVLATEIVDLIIAIIFFLLVSVEEQRKNVIGELKQNAERLSEALEIIRGEDRAKNEFIATLAHELRNPLATLLSSTELLAAEMPGEGGESREIVDIMHGRIRTMGKLLDDLLDTSRIARRELVINKEPVALPHLVRSALETVGHNLQKKKQTLSVSLPMETVTLDADRVRLEQVLVNLLGNAVKYTPEGGHVDFTAKFKDDVLTIRVADNGVGIPPDMFERIFEPFVQVKEGKTSGEGFGIGLALAKNIVELHGGTIRAKANMEGKGAAFIVTLPAKKAEGAFAERFRERPEPHVALLPTTLFPDGLNILVVDDNEDAARGLAKLLSLKGHNVSVAHTGSEALRFIEKAKPQLVLLDLGLPDMSGIEVARALPREASSPILAAVTGYGQEKDKGDTREAGFRFHLTKPVGLRDIEEIIASLETTHA